MRTAVQSLLLLLLAVFAGCYETTFAVGKVEDATIDESLLGHWDFETGPNEGDRATLEVTKFDAHQYKLDWRGGDGKLLPMVGYTAQVKGATFVHAAGVDEQGKPVAKRFLFRLDRDGNDTITISNLSNDFLAAKKIDSDKMLCDAIEANLDNPNLYDAEVMIGKRGK